MSYNALWARAYQFASNRGMTLHRAYQFAEDYARTYEGSGHVNSPEAFEGIAEACDFHYHP